MQMNAEKNPSPSQLADHDADLCYRDVLSAPFVVTGFPWQRQNDNWNRLPESIMAKLPEQLAWVAPQPSGGMIRFKTNSKKLRLCVRLTRAEKSATVTPVALSGFCVYQGQGPAKQFLGLLAPAEPLLEFQADLALKGDGDAELTLYTPLQNPIAQIKLGLDRNASLRPPTPFAIAQPILFYGSSITCGFCASRPGLTYPARVCRELDAELINLGFGGAAKGEPLIAETIAALGLACFVMDYDHNAPNLDHLRQTHRPFFEIVRRARPKLPIVLVSSPSYHADPDFYGQRRQVVFDTYEAARRAGDDRVWFIDGRNFFPPDRWGDCTLDHLHPNDVGLQRMAEQILSVVKSALHPEPQGSRVCNPPQERLNDPPSNWSR